MVRFSDLLGGNDDSDESRPATVSAPLVTEPDPQAEAPEPVATPEDVLDRLTQYATSARAGDDVSEALDPVPDPAANAPTTEETVEETVEEFKPVGDDLLPRAAARKPSRGRKRRP